MKKSNSELVIDNAPSNRKTILQRNPSLKSTLTHPQGDRDTLSASLAKIKTTPKANTLPPHPFLKIDTQRVTFYGNAQKIAQIVTLQNIGKEMLKINLALPRTKYFQLSQDGRAFTLPAGMSRKVTVDLNPNLKFNDDAYCDEIVVQTENHRDYLRLEWFARRPCLKYCPLIDLKALDLGRQHRITLDFHNQSSDHTLSKIRLVKDAWDNIQITPDEFSLPPLKKTKVEVIVYPQTLGAYHHKIVVEVEERLLQPIQITYAAIDFAFRIQNQKQEQVKAIDFGTLLRGTRKQIALYAHNNSPNEIELKSKIKIGKNLKAESTLQSPQELGVECSSTVIQILTKNMRIAPFSRKKIILTTQTQAEDRQKLLVDRFARTESLTAALKEKLIKEESQHHQILVCEFLDVGRKEGEPLITLGSKNVIVTPMHAKFSLPMLKVTPNSLSLGQVLVGGTLQAVLMIENMSTELGCQLSVGKLFSFDFFLLKPHLLPKETSQLQVYLRGTNIGTCHANLQLLIADTYSIRIPIDYEVANQSTKEDRLYRTGFNSTYNSQEINFNKTLLNTKTEQHRSIYDRVNFRKGVPKGKSSQSLFQRDIKGTQVLESLRNSTSKAKESNGRQKFESEAEPSCGLPQRQVSSSQGRKYNLFVTKKIDKYHPYQQLKQHKKLQKTRNTRDYFNTTVRRAPKNRKQAEQVARELTPQELKLVSINQKIISFGRVFIRSRVQRQFIIGNSTEAALIVQLHPNIDPKKHSFLAETDFETQIIGQNGAARLKVVFNAQNCGKFESTISYTINGVHSFQLLVQAEVELVSLSISKNSLRMAYLDDVTEILLKDSFVLKNQGNTAANFSITQSATKFIIQPDSATIPAGDSITVWVMENNQNYPVIQAGETYSGKPTAKTTSALADDRILIKIVDGNDISLKVTATPGLCDPRCIVKEQKLVFGCTIVSKPKSKTFQLKNLSRSICLFQIFNAECQEFLSFDCVKGRIPPEGAKEITATYRSTLLHTLLSNFQILIRGGLIINVPIQAESVAPEVSIVQNDFDFGQICCDTAAVKPISIRNQSETMVELFIDLRSRQRGVEYLMVSLWGSVATPLGQKAKITPTYRAASFQEEIVDNAIREQGVHRIKVEAKTVLTFNLIFKPTIAGYYQFVLPLFLENFIRNESLSKLVSCSAIQPKFVIQPSIIRFKKKIISDKENSCFHPFVEFLTIRNPTDRVLKWKLDMHGQHKTGTSFSSYSSATPYSNKREVLAPKLCFQVEEKRGELRPKESVSINVSFNPLQQGYYCHKVPLYIFSEQKGTYHQEAEIRLQGQGKYPSLYFNRKQLIMPVVPIGIESISMLEVYNEGYESINLKHRFQIMDGEGNVHLSKGNLAGDHNFPQIIAVFPQGIKMSTTKRQLFIILKFIAKRSMSFTCKLELYDEATDCRTYSIPISGTAENSLLTTFAYLSDPQNIYRLQPCAQPSDIKKQKGREDTPAFSVALRTNDGRNLIDRYHSLYDQMTLESFTLDCRILKRWLNNFFREEKVRDFPGDLSQNGQLLLKLLHKLTGRKQFQGSWEYESEGGREILDGHGSRLAFYEAVLRVLKTMGCLLNHIRPYYLLEREEFLQHMAKDPNWRIYADYYLKQHDLIFRQAWVVLLYQIIQHFWCARPKADPARPASNVYSPAELQVLRWVKGIYEHFHPLEDSKQKFLSFGRDYKDCVAPIHCLLKYSIPPRQGKALDSLIRKPIAPHEFASNTKLLYQMLDRLNIVPLIYEDEYQLCREKQIFLFMHQLYEILPQTYPRLPPLIFACELGQSCSRVIDIRNPSNKAVHYWVKLDGCRDFTFEEKDSIVIEPKSIYAFTVDYKSRLSSEQVAYISFFSKQEAEVNSINGSALVFELRSKITGRKSIKKLENISCPLYQTISLKVLVQNIFEDHDLANFSIQIIEESQDSPPVAISLLAKYKTDSDHYDPMALLEKERDNPTSVNSPKPTQFYCEVDSLKIKKGSASSFDLYYMPLRLSKTKCLLIFNDPNVGQFQYELVGSAEIPKPLQEIKYQSSLMVGSKDCLELNLPVYNSYMLKCESYFEQKCLDASSRKNNRERPQERYKLELNMDPKITQYIIFPPEVILKNQKKDISTNVDFQNRIKLQYHFPHLLKDLTLDFLLIGDPKKNIQDVRRFRVGLNIAHKPMQQELVMTTTARKPLCQPIPIDNTSGKDWKVKVSVLENQNGWLTLKQGERVALRELVVKKGQCQNINICFQPRWIGKAVGKVSIHNQTTNEQLIFNIKGIAEQPLSENHYHLKVNTEDSTLFTIPIGNPYHERITYRILSDIQELQLPPQITMDADEQIQFNFIAQCIQTSPLIGFIKFIDIDGRFFWYSLTLECAERKVREFWVQMSVQVGKQIQKLVQFKNPFNRQLFFKVEFPKDVGLQAKQQFVVNSHSVHQYKIKFRPFKPVNTEVALKAFNKDIGNFIYHTKLTAKQQIRRRLYAMSVQVGKVGTLDFRLDSSFRTPLKVNYQISNPAFEVEIPELLMPNENTCRLKFKPAAEGKQLCTLKVWGQHFPTRLFDVEGTGIAPYSIQAITFKAHANQICLQIIKFSNPNPKKGVQVARVCLSEAQHGCFRIVGHPKQETWQTQMKDLLVIPIQFQPKEKGYFQSVLTVQCFNYQWKYLLKGSTSFKESERANEQVTATCKEEVIKLLKIPLPQYIKQGTSYFDRVEIEHPEKKIAKYLRGWMKLKLNNTLRPQDEDQERVITVYLKFRPKKQIKELVKLVLFNSGEEGPKISYNLQVNVLDCGPENIIPLEITSIKGIHFDIGLAGLGLKQTQLTKTTMGKAAYCQAQILSEHIRIKFKPNHLIFNRSRIYTDNLLVESEEEQWNFQVQFTLKK